MATLTPEQIADLQSRLAKLNKVRGSGVMSIQHDGRRIQYQNGESLDTEISKIETALRNASSPKPKRMFRLYQSGTGL